MRKNRIRDLMNEHTPIILDGAMATEIEKQGIAIDSALWAAAVIHCKPSSIKKVHLDYFRAGADIATTNTYQATLAGFQQSGYTELEAERFIKEAVNIAIQARCEFWETLTVTQKQVCPYPLVAGSVGPYGAFLADGSEYTGEYALNEAGYRMFHRSRMHLLKEAGADLFAFETMPNFDETKVLAELLTHDFPDDEAWLSFSLADDTHLCDGTPLADAAAYFNAVDQISAIGINCVAMKRVEAAIMTIREITSKPIIVYPNSGERYNPRTKQWEKSKMQESYGSASKTWFEAGASLIGGCCRTSPDDIRKIAEWARLK
ncbi:homocysteine S-methyltransferase [Sporolactobacillus shoreicorticis]|uniref:Homocysteine S-methyltransferase n=1 Tax=Sporolactobacillus shoreicorticis TaxID=1923877 RepID=A0ABW5RZ81_9BACL|nr:homocysteine S-methyltransferase [Sporolactobacillus shoreicorticis]MCO7128152.1 homocysteine S-methyltransferase [Sporolactobacillus shoreicorticis]